MASALVKPVPTPFCRRDTIYRLTEGSLITAPFAIPRIEASPHVSLIKILWIGASHHEIDVLHAPVVRITESEDHMVIDLPPFRRRFMLRPQPPLSGLMENLRTATRKRSLLSRFPPKMPDVEP